jgi:ribosome-binding protein aMBF1 (putative translation factor)
VVKNGVVFGKRRRGDAVPAMEMVKKVADAFDVTLDYLVDESAAGTFDKKTVGRIQELQSLPDEEQRHVFAMVDAFLRDARARVAYAG